MRHELSSDPQGKLSGMRTRGESEHFEDVTNCNSFIHSETGVDSKQAQEHALAVVERIKKNIKALGEQIQDQKCRICLGEEEEQGSDDSDNDSERSEKSKDRIKNPLLAPCNCTGSSKYIHLECLREWLERSLSDYPSMNCLTRIYKINSCELCKTKYPD